MLRERRGKRSGQPNWGYTFQLQSAQKCTLFVPIELGAAMKNVSVFAVVGAALRDLVIFIRQRPATVLLATAITAPLEYWIALTALAAEDNGSLKFFAAALALSILALVVWLPLWLVATRHIVSGVEERVYWGGALSEATLRYAVYNVFVLVSVQSLSSDWSDSVAALIVKVAFGLALTWFAVRTTLFFTALAVGRRDLGVSQSIARTSGQTFRLVGILVLTLTAALAIPFVAAVVLVLILGEMGGDARLYPTAFFGVMGQFAALTTVMAGAHIYRVIEQDVPQNGRY